MSDEPTTIKSAHALILNRLNQMQSAPYYATAKEELALAETTIVELERELAQAKAQSAKQDAAILAAAREHVADLDSWDKLNALCQAVRGKP